MYCEVVGRRIVVVVVACFENDVLWGGDGKLLDGTNDDAVNGSVNAAMGVK